MLLDRPFLLLATVNLLLASLFTATTATDNATRTSSCHSFHRTLTIPVITPNGGRVTKALPDGARFDRSMPQDWRGQATIEVYMLSDTGKPSDSINSMGNNVDPKAYGVLYEGLSYLCRDMVGNDGNQCHIDREFWAPSLAKFNGQIGYTSKLVPTVFLQDRRQQWLTEY
jgi:hypothetical protein